MQQWMLTFVNQFGYLGIFLLILIENIFPPIPSEAVLLFGGALTVTTAMNVPGTILAATAGSVLGAIVLYAFGRIFQAERLKRLFAGRFGQITKLRPEHVEKAESWFRRYQGKAVLHPHCQEPDFHPRRLCQDADARIFAADHPGQRGLEHGAGLHRLGAGQRLGTGHALL